MSCRKLIELTNRMPKIGWINEKSRYDEAALERSAACPIKAVAGPRCNLEHTLPVFGCPFEKFCLLQKSLDLRRMILTHEARVRIRLLLADRVFGMHVPFSATRGHESSRAST